MISIKQKIARVIIALTFLFCTGIVVNGEDGKEILKKAIDSEGMVDLFGFCYTASFMKPYEFSNNVKVFWKSPNKIRMEYLAGNIVQMTVITTKDKSFQFPSAGNVAYVKEFSQHTKDLERRKQELLLSNYDAKITGKESIAGREANVLRINCRYPDRPSKKLWIDDKTNVILKSEQYNSSGDLMLLTYFKTLDFNPDLNDSLFAPPPGVTLKLVSEKNVRNFEIKELSKITGFNVVTPSFIPEGYILEGAYVYRCGCGVDMAHLRYFDGLNSISIFEGKKDCPICGEGAVAGFFRRGMGMMGRGRGRRMGCAPKECELLEQREERVLAFTDKDLRFVIIGDIPSSAADRIAQGLKK